MTFSFSQRSLNNLKGVHPDLVKVVNLALEQSEIDFSITEGLRSVEKQKMLVAKGASQTMRSRHLTGHAVDLAAILDGEIRWDWPLYKTLAQTMKSAAHQLEIPLEWGGDWVTLKDGPHFQLPWKDYPA